MVKFVASVFVFFCLCVCVCKCMCAYMCVFRGDIWAPFILRGKVPIFLTITLVGLEKT